MAYQKKNNKTTTNATQSEKPMQQTNSNPVQTEDFAADLIKQINKDAGNRIAYNLASDESPTNVKRWISTGSKQLDMIISNKPVGGLPEGRIIEIQGPPSCHAKGDQLVMFDGSLKNIEDVVVGDQLMGPDSTPRTVIKTHVGMDDIYKLNPGYGGKIYHVSKHHILPLYKTTQKGSGPKYIEISVADYVKQKPWFKRSYSLKRQGVDFQNNNSFVIPPYILGLLIGDGWLSTARIELTTADQEIEEEFKTFCESFGYEMMPHYKKNNSAKGLYPKTGFNPGKTFENKDDGNVIRKELRRLGLLDTDSGSKFIPEIYKTSNRTDRLELLAGLVDTDGCLGKTGRYEFCSKSLRLVEDVIFVVRTLGFVCGEPREKIVNGTSYYKIHFCAQLPSRLKRKTSAEKCAIKTTHRFKLDPVGLKEIYGVTTDKDHKYLMSDTTIQNNCGKSHIGYAIAKSTQQMGGIVVYIDTENATSPENLVSLGVSTGKNFVFIQETCIEEIFKVIESVIEKARNMKNDVPVTVIWDSVAASSPKAELDGDYDQNTIGLAARVLSKGFRKITQTIADKNVLLVLMQQQRVKIGVMYGDPCLSPETKIHIRRRIREDSTNTDAKETSHLEEEITFAELAERFHIDDLDDPEVYDTTDEGYEILSYDLESGNQIWKPLEAFVVKKNAPEHYRLEDIQGTAEHKILHNGSFIRLADHPQAILVKEPIQVVDCQVADTHNYIAEGHVHHNTTTSGGMAIPYHASVRIKLTGGSQIKETINGKELVTGISVTAKTIKNKVARPWREAAFDIIFGVGIKEDEQLFDALREFCAATKEPVMLQDLKVSIDGTAQWKSFTVFNTTTNAMVHEVKFYKADFREKVLNVSEFQPYLATLMEACFVLKNNVTEHTTLSPVDMTSVEEVEAMNLESE